MRKDSGPIRVFVVEDHAVMRGMLCETVERQPESDLAGAASSAEEALATMDPASVDLVLVDLSLPRMSGVELVRRLSKRTPALPCLIVSGHVEVAYARQALEVAARGYVLKGRPADLAAGIQAAVSGKRYVSSPLEEVLGEEDAVE